VWRRRGSTQGEEFPVIIRTRTVRARRPGRWGSATVLVVAAAVALIVPMVTRAPRASALGSPTAHLAVIMMENQESSTVVGNPNAPYINTTVIPDGRLFISYHAVTHPSLPNYLILTSAGTGDCVVDSCPRNADPEKNVFYQMDSANPAVSWKAYAESMPSNCYPSNLGAYLVRHNPPLYYVDLGVGGTLSCSRNDVPYAQLSTDLGTGTLPAFAWVIPNQYDDMHTDQSAAPCNLGSSTQDKICQGDRWLQANLPALLHDGGRDDVTALILFDEGSTGQLGGGHVPAIEIGPNTCAGCQETGQFNHYGMLAAVEDWFGLPRLGPAVPSL